jgi:hypothetical protein
MSLVSRNSGSLARDNSTTQNVGKGLVVAGGSGVAVAVLAALLPFVGVLGTGVVLALVGLALMVKR